MTPSQKPPTPRDTPEAQAFALLQQGSYKEAITAYKALLKTEHRPEWKEQLAQAYLQRALGLAQKDLYAEAIVLWENYAAICETPEAGENFAAWLLRIGNYVKLSGYLKRYPQWLDNPRLAETLGVLLLSNDKLLAQLPADSALLKHYSFASKALQAYCKQNDAEVDSYLRQIPVRSAYRDLRSLLKALLLRETDRIAAQQVLEKIPAVSPYRVMADIVGSDFHDPNFVERYIELNPEMQSFCQKFFGFEKNQIALLKDIQKLSKHYSDRTAFEAVLAERNKIGLEHSRQLCMRLLPHYPAGLKIFEKTFGKLPRYQHERLLALQEHLKSRKGDIDIENAYWRKCVDELKKEPEKEDNALTAALILRRIADSEDSYDPDIAIECLIDSLALDSDDKAAYLQLLKLLDGLDRVDEYQEWLDRTLKQYPQDVEILMMAMQASANKKAFKKAAGYAKAVLEVDAINVHAKRMLIQCHIAHARKLIATNKYALADQELNQAQQLEHNRRSGVVQIVQGLAAFKQNKKEQAQALLQSGASDIGNTLCSHFCICAETLTQKLPLPQILSLLPDPAIASKQNVLDLMNWLARYAETGVKDVPAALKELGKVLHAALKKHNFTENEHSEICRHLHQVGAYELLTFCVKEWRHHMQFKPLFVYYAIIANCRGKIDKIDNRDIEQLYDALDDAEEADNEPVQSLIRALLQKIRKRDEKKHFEEMRSVFDQLKEGDSPAEMLKMLLGAKSEGEIESIMSIVDKLEDMIDSGQGFPDMERSHGKPQKR